MGLPRLTVDLGNTRAKLRLWPRPEDRATGAVVPLAGVELALEPEDIAARVGTWLAGLATPFEAALVSVGSPHREEAVAAAVAERAERLLVDVPPGVENACRAPERVGRDRLFAARGALEQVGRSCVVVDAGTALTVDAVERGPAGDRFLGGAIAPGPALGARALAEGAARLPRVVPEPGAPALGRDTEAAIRGGLAVGFRGAARELARAVAREAGFGEPPVVLTGGARDFLLGQPSAFDGLAGLGPLVPSADLVHLGLLAAAFGAPPGDGS